MATWGFGGVSSVQQGSGTIALGYTAGLETVNVTITAVVMAKSTVQAWIVVEDAIGVARFDIAPVLTSMTNLRLYMSSNVAADQNFKYTWQVITYY